MCVSYAEETSTSTTTYGGAGIEQMVVTAPRIGIDLGTFQRIDWSEVMPMTVLGGIGGVFSGWPGVVVGAAIGTAGAVESQDDVDLVHLFRVTNDIYSIPVLPAPYLPLL
jgi:hypothetical protein